MDKVFLLIIDDGQYDTEYEAFDSYEKAHKSFANHLKKYWEESSQDLKESVDDDGRMAEEVLGSDYYIVDGYMLMIREIVLNHTVQPSDRKMRMHQ